MRGTLTTLLIATFATTYAKAGPARNYGYGEISAISYESETWQRSNSGPEAGTQYTESPTDTDRHVTTGGNIILGIRTENYLWRIGSQSLRIFRVLSDELAIGGYLFIENSDKQDNTDRSLKEVETKTTNYALGPTVLGHIPLAPDFAFEWSALITAFSYRNKEKNAPHNTKPSTLSNASKSNWTASAGIALETFVNERFSLLSGFSYHTRQATYRIEVDEGGNNGVQYAYTSKLKYQSLAVDLLTARMRF